MHEGKIESAKLQIDEAVRILQGAIETIREAKRYQEDPAHMPETEQAKRAREAVGDFITAQGQRVKRQPHV